MFVIRQASSEDVQSLLKLARLVHSFNLPADRDAIAGKIVKSVQSFEDRLDDPHDRTHMFVLEDLETGNVIGTSSIIGHVSWPGHPHVYLEVSRREFWSDDLQQGATHVVLELGTDESGPSELGGLILAPGYRGHAERLGGLLSMVRFQYLALHRKHFGDRIIAEVMGSLTPDSHNVLWDYLGRRFINLSYTEADLFCRRSKEFITALFPREPIYASILPPEARNLIARESDESRGARAMLERQGFEYHGHIDPFDGGPYLEASIDAIPLVGETRSLRFAGSTRAGKGVAIVSSDGDEGFRAVRTPYQRRGDDLRLPAAAIEALEISTGDRVGFTALDGGPATRSTSTAKKTGKPSTSTKKAASGKSASRKTTSKKTAPKKAGKRAAATPRSSRTAGTKGARR